MFCTVEPGQIRPARLALQVWKLLERTMPCRPQPGQVLTLRRVIHLSDGLISACFIHTEGDAVGELYMRFKSDILKLVRPDYVERWLGFDVLVLM